MTSVMAPVPASPAGTALGRNSTTASPFNASSTKTGTDRPAGKEQPSAESVLPRLLRATTSWRRPAPGGRTRTCVDCQWNGQLVGEVSYQVDPPMCVRKITGTAWVGILIGEKNARHRGIGRDAMSHVETEIRLRGLARIELGVFEFNENARRLYEGLGYREIARIKDFTYWNGRMWQDIRMEKRL